MKISFKTLTLQCKRSREVIEFSNQISVFHGQISAGKSSIARLIDFCLGGKLERTPALKEELVSVQLTAHIDQNEVLFEREAHGGANQVQVTWQNDAGESGSVLAPIRQGESPIWNEDIFNLSDLIFHFFGITPLKVRRNKKDSDSPLIRLSFRDMMWYCYLDQDHLDSSFFRLEDSFRGPKSRDVMRFIVGYYSERLNLLEMDLESVRSELHDKLKTAENLRNFLQQFELGSEDQISKEIELAEIDLKAAEEEIKTISQDHAQKTHFADDLRRQLRNLSDMLAKEEQAAADLEERINEQKALKAELTSAKFKLARMKSAITVLSGVSFIACPACGSSIDSENANDVSICQLCGKKPTTSRKMEEISSAEEIMRRDLTSRIEELSESIKRHVKAFKKQGNIVEELKGKKYRLDRRLTRELNTYDSAFLAAYRELERRSASLEERLRGLEKLRKIPEFVVTLEEESDVLTGKLEGLKREIQREKEGLTDADVYIEKIEDTFLSSLLRVRLPGVKSNDKVRINHSNWAVNILPSGKEDKKWSFYQAGSGGKKTLFNVCYAIAIHLIASEHKLPLPQFLIIDTPMKNIGEDVNRDIFESFYNYLYDLAQGPLSDTQIIIIDKEFIEPEKGELEIRERFMTPDDPGHPPLIPYYKGP